MERNQPPRGTGEGRRGHSFLCLFNVKMEAAGLRGRLQTIEKRLGLHSLPARSQMESAKKVEISRLRAFELFAALKEEELAEIAEICEEATIQAGTILIRQGQVGKDVYLLEEGSVGVYRGDSDAPHFLAVLHAPTLFGEMALLDPERIRTASVKALSNLRLLSVPIVSFLSRVRRFPSLREKLRQLVAERS